MHSKMFIVLMAGVLAATLGTACAREETTETTTDTTWGDTAYTETGTTATRTDADRTGMGDTGPGAEWVSSVRLGREINAEGGVPIGSASSTFRTGEPIYIAMEIDERPPQGDVRVVWFGPTNNQIGEDTRQVQPDTVINFRAPDGINQPGEYRVDVMAGNALVKTERFTIER
jgi:hypothetical protein